MDEAVPTPDEVAAALAAISLYLADAPTAPRESLEPRHEGWQNSIKRIQQQSTPTQPSLYPAWGTIERLRRQ